MDRQVTEKEDEESPLDLFERLACVRSEFHAAVSAERNELQ